MSQLTVDIPDDIMQKLEEQDQPLQSLLLEAISEYLEKRSLAKTKTWSYVELLR